ncbi:molecular chaperone DnaJ [Altererythrobacter arenosus]|uniref:Molecular chaperone DnaJ n=1 Tax=Altererythrobacter arenosus TaxID=3032592 RepID=A0ABY8FXQ4_9SPHN|nr:molecular chaperone DnaJ [Altererythrobacter sp. CAU 1644]WFL78783.1 molecular chaperone DnaJ [Altererythrobacter sp. CAU 1644]
MLRLVIIVAIASVFCKWALGKWPWDYLRPTSTRQQAIFKARKLLAVRENATHSEILEAHKRLITMVHPDRGGSNDQVHEANAARDLLLDELPDVLPDQN